MVNPILIKKDDNPAFTPSKNAKRLFQAVYYAQNPPVEAPKDIPLLSVSEIVSKMAFYYEKIRNTVEYKEEHLLRKNAIERILKRQIVIERAASPGSKGVEIARHLLTELIRAAYLPNNIIPETKIDEFGKVIDKYVSLRRYAVEDYNSLQIKEKNALTNWIIALAASDLEERLGRSQVNLVIVDYMYQTLLDNISLDDVGEHETDREIQIFVAIHRSYLKFDRDMVSYILLKYFHPDWQQAGEEEIAYVGKNILAIKKAIDDQIDHPLASQLNRIVTRYTVFFQILNDVIANNPVKVYESFYQDPKAFSRMIKQAAGKRYREAKSKLWRAAVRSILYIFITKSFLAFILEIPATRLFGEEINPISLFINVTFPAVLLFLIVLFSRMPTEANSLKIIEGVREVVFEENKRKEPYRLRKPVKRSTFSSSLFGVIYAITFFLSFGAVVWALNAIHFSAVSIIIFLFFLALVSFFSIRIRKNARDLLILPPKESALSFIADFFYVPIVSAGKWLSENFSKVNVFVFILDFIIEAPFKVFVAITEEWTRYVKERKDEIV
ncbi:hypothetical protein KAR28_03185 [Candidatus Parcubacteria bacterium]|nr:hypothetical protein [Candidatus Parcubacteria bacterium]